MIWTTRVVRDTGTRSSEVGRTSVGSFGSISATGSTPDADRLTSRPITPKLEQGLERSGRGSRKHEVVNDETGSCALGQPGSLSGDRLRPGLRHTAHQYDRL